MLDYALTPELLKAWVKYYEFEPFLADRIEAQLSFISAQIYNIFAKEPKGAEFFKVSTKAEQKDKKAEFEKRLKDVFFKV